MSPQPFIQSNVGTDYLTRDLADASQAAAKLGASPLKVPLTEACKSLSAVLATLKATHGTICKRFQGSAFVIKKAASQAADSVVGDAAWGVAGFDAAREAAASHAVEDAAIEITKQVLSVEGAEAQLRALGDRAQAACAKAETLTDRRQKEFTSLFSLKEDASTAIVFLSTVERCKSLTPDELRAEWQRQRAENDEQARTTFEPACIRALDSIIDGNGTDPHRRRDGRLDHAIDPQSEAALLKRQILTARDQRVPPDVAASRKILEKLYSIWLELCGVSGRYVSYGEYITRSSKNPNAIMSKWDQYPTWPTRFLPGSPYRLPTAEK